MDNINASKLKLLYLLKILQEESDEDNELTMNDLIEKLGKYNIKAERKSVTRDLNSLCDFGYDISLFEDRKGYYLRERDFDQSELRFLIDVVLSSRCITTKKSTELISKLEKQTSKTTAKKLRANRSISDRIKCKNEEFYYNIDKISTAISENKKITFQYYTYNVNKTKTLKGGGRIYELSPYDLVWNEDFYYLIGNHDKYPDFTHYRIDRMHNIQLIEQPRRSITEIKDYDSHDNTSTYMKKTFRMFGGESTRVEIKFPKDMIDTIIDRFGEDTVIILMDKEHFKVCTEVNAGEGFISWILQFGEKAEVLEPQKIRLRIKNKIEQMSLLYK
jgi:predicted DNA-binding transcriptional regulator YafY